MKKLLFAVFALTITLSGCGATSDYQSLVNETADLAKSDSINVEIGATVKDFDVNYNVTFDMKNKFAQVSVFGQDFYISEDTVYAKLLSNWVKVTLQGEDLEQVKKFFDADILTLDLPEGDAIVSEVETSSEGLNEAVNNKSYDELFVKNEDGTYTIKGLESFLTIATDEGFKIEFNDPADDVKIHVTYAKGDKISLPKEADDAKDITSTVY